MRIALLYPPPWRIPESGDAADPDKGPPDNYQPGDLDADFYQTPYGLLSLAAQAIAAGHDVKVLNLSGYTWQKTVETVAALDAELFGLSCWTANRRGVDMVSQEIRKHHPGAHIVVGGPHASPLAREVLEHYHSIDTVSVGESEEQFMDLISALQQRRSPRGIPGTYYRAADGTIEKAPPRPAIKKLDELASPHSYFGTHIIMTSRGCPWQCTFCGAETTWGRGFRGQSVDRVLDNLENALDRVPVRMLLLKDDTFTANKKRAHRICKGIIDRGIRFLWSCDTRVDVLTEELLLIMRQAGCQRLSLGVESGSPEILQAIDKKITPDKILHAAEMAKRVGIQVRFYMMLGNRGETRETFQETLEFLDTAQPHQYLFSCLSVYPGTVDFHDAEAAGWISRKQYFEETFQELKVPFDVSEEDGAYFSSWFESHCGLRHMYRPGVEALQGVLQVVGEHHAAHLDLASAYYAKEDWDGAVRHAQRALELNTPVPGLAHNLLACVAASRFRLKPMQEHLKEAIRTDPYHFVVARNAESIRRWFVDGGPVKGLPLNLDPSTEFQLFEKTRQPTLPGPLPEDFANWTRAAPSAPPVMEAPRRHLPVA